MLSNQNFEFSENSRDFQKQNDVNPGTWRIGEMNALEVIDEIVLIINHPTDISISFSRPPTLSFPN